MLGDRSLALFCYPRNLAVPSLSCLALLDRVEAHWIFKNTSPSRPLARNLSRSVLSAVALRACSKPLSGRWLTYSPSMPAARSWFNLLCKLQAHALARNADK